MSSTKITLGLLAVVSTAGCDPRLGFSLASPSVTPIVNGVADTSYLGVGALVIDFGGGDMAMCTAARIADQWLLTAAGCVDGRQPADVTFFTGNDINVESSGDWYTASALEVHEEFSTNPEVVNDVALVKVVGLSALPIYAYSTAAPSVGTSVTWVGYGVNVMPAGTGHGYRRSGTGEIAETTTTTIGYEYDSSLPCFGDHGGPTFASIQGVSKIVGVISYADADCSAFSIDMRVDAYANWISGKIAAGSEDGGPTDGGDPDGGDAMGGDAMDGGDAAGGDAMDGGDPMGGDAMDGGDAAGGDATDGGDLAGGDAMDGDAIDGGDTAGGDASGDSPSGGDRGSADPTSDGHANGSDKADDEGGCGCGAAPSGGLWLTLLPLFGLLLRRVRAGKAASSRGDLVLE